MFLSFWSSVWPIWVCVAAGVLLTLLLALVLLHLLDENLALRREVRLLKVREASHTNTVQELTARVQRASLMAQSAQRGWSRWSAPELEETERLAAV